MTVNAADPQFNQTDHDRLVALHVALVGYDGRNGMRGQIHGLEEKHGEIEGKVDGLDAKVDARFQKLFSRIWWIMGVLVASTTAIVAAIIESHAH